MASTQRMKSRATKAHSAIVPAPTVIEVPSTLRKNPPDGPEQPAPFAHVYARISGKAVMVLRRLSNLGVPEELMVSRMIESFGRMPAEQAIDVVTGRTSRYFRGGHVGFENPSEQ